MTITVALAGDVMLGRKVGERLNVDHGVFDDELSALTRAADLFVCNLECCISTRGEPWPDAGKPFFFRAPPVAADILAEAGVDAVTLANNHALDFGWSALADTRAHLDRVGIAHTGAGPDAPTARRPVVITAGGLRLGLVALSDHPRDFAAGADEPGIAFADLDRGVPGWVSETLSALEADLRLVSPHWGPNMTTEPVASVRAAAGELARAGADLVAGHSAHVPHGVARVGGTPVLYDLGDFLDDYAVNPDRRNDLGLLWLLEVDAAGVHHIEAVPAKLDFCHTRPADRPDVEWLHRRLSRACAALGTEAVTRDGRIEVRLPSAG